MNSFDPSDLFLIPSVMEWADSVIVYLMCVAGVATLASSIQNQSAKARVALGDCVAGYIADWIMNASSTATMVLHEQCTKECATYA